MAEQTPQTTEYVVLSQTPPSPPNGTSGVPAGLWRQIAVVAARSANEAIKTAADTKTEAVYVAVPARSFNPVRVTPKVETTLVLAEVPS